ncbi:hypothetical protein COL5a_000713 [Colletotrichum fioriniae]|nr:hypothetical protein COL5a_000713 [Colletotrichum fioriniae]
MTSVSFPPSRPDRKLSPFGGTSTGGFGSRPDVSKNVLGLNGASAGGGQRSTRNLNNQPPDMTTPATKRKGVNPFDGASSDDNRRRKNTKGDSQGEWKKKGLKAQGAKPNGAKAPKGFGTTQSRGGFGNQNNNNNNNNNNHSSGSTDYETDDANGELNGDGTAYSDKIFSQLRQDGIAPPKWPSDPGNTSSKAAMAKFREEYKTYRDRARTSLMRAGLIDDPDKPKRLEDAIDFKGICDAMCPDFEKITRITEFDVQSAEKDPRTTFANTSKMVKKLARSAAGQEAPLPMDVRSTAALRRTLDYLIDDLLPIDDKLPSSHGFLWDRTRAIRRDFIFHSTMSPEEMKDQVYCLETIARFHVTALHLLSQEGFAPEDFSEQQEIEQLGKALLSLMFAYDDCKPQGVVCENEAEFRAYHLLFSANTPNILDNVQKEWGDARFWTESDTIRTAVSLVESLQSAEDFHGPLGSGPSMATSGAHLTYFRILQSREVSYTMACFAEIHLGQLRRSVLRSLKKAYTRPRHGAKDITPSSLNRFLHFDTEDQAIEFVEQHGLSFSNGQGPAGEPISDLTTLGAADRLAAVPEVEKRSNRIHNQDEMTSGGLSLAQDVEATEGPKPTSTNSSPFGNPFSTGPSPSTGASPVQQSGPASSSSATTAPALNPFAAKTSPFGKSDAAAESATPSNNPFGSLNQPNGTSQPKASSTPAFPPATFGTGAQPKAPEQARPGASTDGSPAITVTPPTPKFPLPASTTAAESSEPVKPAPLLQQSFPPAIASPVPPAASPLAQVKPPQAPPVKQRSKKDVMADFAKWFVTGDNGLIQEFEKYMVEQLVSAAFEQYHREEEERKRREEEERDLAEARKFQVYNLSVKYFYRWREIARNLRLTKLRRQEREEYRRVQREQREEEIRQRKKAAKVAEAKKRALERNGFDPVEEFRELLQLRKDGTQADLQAEAEALLATGILSGVSNERIAAANVIRAPGTMETIATNTPLPRSRSSTALSQSTTGAKSRGAKTRAIREEFGKSATNFRRSLPPMSAHSSSSRLSSEPQKRVSKVSDRWRLKAMGLVTMPDGTALPETIANEMRYNGKRYAGLGSFGLDATERRRSVSADLNHAAEARLRFSQSLNGGSGSGSAAALSQVNGISPLSKRKRALDDDDNEVAVADEAATRVKKRPSSNAEIDRILREARENLESLRSSRIELDEGADWFREQNEMMHAEEASRASSPWGKSGHR